MLAHVSLGLPSLFILIINGINILIGIFVLLRKPDHLVNRAFFLFVLGTSAWGAGIALLYVTHAFVFDKLVLGGGLLMFFGLTLFARVFPSKTVLARRFYVLFIPLLITSSCLPFNLFIKSIVVDKSGLIQPINGPLFPLYVATAAGYLFAAFYFFRRSFKQSTGQARMQMLYFFTGTCVFMLSILFFNILLPLFGVYQLNLVGPLTSIIFVLITGYAIVRHQLMDIRVIIQRGLIYSILFSVAVAIYAALLFLTESFFDSAEEIITPLFAGIIMLTGIVTVPSIERYFRRITDGFFFKNHYNYASALQKLSAILNENIHFSDMTMQVLEMSNSILRPSRIAFSHIGTKTTFELLTSNGLHKPPPHNSKDEIHIPVIARGRTIGTFTFGRKLSEEIYTKEDMLLLRTFADQAAVAFEKAELFQELQNYSKSLETQVQVRTQKLVQMQEDQRQLFDDISHALQTPITVLKGALELFKKNPDVTNIKILEPMEHGVDDLSRLIREILQLARIDAALMKVEFTEIDLSRLVKDVLEYVEIICKQNDISVTIEIETDIQIAGNKKQLEEMLTNILSNSVKYTAGCPTKEIRVSLKKKEGFAELLVQDTGAGISSERLPYIFDRFYRAQTRDETGYGLGLAITKRIIEEHQGTIHAESVLGKGTSMRIRFPI